MRVHLLNSAMMPSPGTYHLIKIDKNIFKMLLEKYYSEGKLQSFIGYEQNLKLIAKWGNIRLASNRDEIRNLQSGDVLLIMKLKYRLKDTNNKAIKEFQQKLTEDDFEFYHANYSV